MKAYTASKRRLRLAVVAKLGGQCAHCGFDDPRCLDVDHIQNTGAVHRIFTKNETLWRMIRDDQIAPGLVQLLCKNCNWIKHLNNTTTEGRKHHDEENSDLS